MAGNTTAGSRGGDLFQRKATGLLRGWSVLDGFIYAAFAINLMTLGLWIFSFAPFIPDGSLIYAIILSGLYLVFQAVTYASLIAVMPRAGGDYVWMSRVLGGGIGFILAVTGWWFILWHWVPIYANILNVEVLIPLATIVGFDGVANFFGAPGGVFTASMAVAILASILISLGMRTYARIQKFCFYGGVIGLVIMLFLLLFNSNADFVGAFNSHAQELYGEVRGASDFRKNIYAMGGALIVTSAVAVIMLLLFAKTFGWDFYYAASNAYWAGEGPISAWPYPGLFAAFLFDSPILQFILVAVLALWFFGWVGSVFLSSTRVVFATAFDRVLPEWVSKPSRNGVPYYALALMLIPSIPISYLYAFGENFATYTLDATLVIAMTFLGSAIAAAVLPWRKPEIYNASPIARYNVLGIPLVTVAASLFSLFLVFCLFKWLTDDTYGINNGQSLIYMAVLYGVALAMYVGFRLLRRAQGMDLNMVYDEIPEE